MASAARPLPPEVANVFCPIAEVQGRKIEDLTVARLKGPQITDLLYIQELGEELTATFEKAQPPILAIDFTDVEFLSSVMLGTLTTLLRRVRKKNGRLLLCAIRPSIYEAFEITRLDRVFEIFADVDEALDSL